MSASVRVSRRVLIALIALGITMVGTTLLAATAGAHASVTATVPADGAHSDRPVTEVAFELNEPVSLVEGSVSILDRAGTRHDVATTRLESGAQRLVVIPVKPLGDDAYLVTARIVSADTHVVSLSARFSVGSVTRLGDIAEPASSGSGPGGGTQWLIKVAVYLGVVLSAGAVLAARWVWPESVTGRRFGLLYRSGLVILAVGLVGRLVLLAAQSVGGWTTLSVASVTQVLDTRLGTAIAVAVVLAVSGLVRTPGAGRGSTLLAYAGAASAIVAVTLGGHGGSPERWPFSLVDTMIHVYAVSVWFGGLAVLAIVSPSPARIARWHRVVAGHLVLVVGSGVVLALWQVDPLAALFTTSYGRVLLAKTAAVGLAVAAGYWVYRRYRGDAGHNDPTGSGGAAPSVRSEISGDPGIGGGTGDHGGVAVLEAPARRTGVADTDETAVAAGTRSRVLALELVVATVVIGLTAILSSLTPARDSYTTDVSAHLDFGNGQVVDVGIDTIRRGDQTLTASYPVRIGAAIPEIQVELASAEANVARLPVDLVRVGDTGNIVWRSEHLIVPAAGRWKVTVRFDAGRGPRVGSFFFDAR